MRSAARVLAVAAVVVAFDASGARADDSSAFPTVLHPGDPDSPRTVARAVTSIRNAPDPSSAVEAYSRASSAGTRAVAVAQEYVRRMTEFGLPEMAESQARQVLASEMSDGLAWAVVAAMRARRGEAADAIAGIATAVGFDPDEPFVQRTAGQILAWHDTRSGRMAEDLETSLAAARAAVAATPEFAKAYQSARAAYAASRGAAPVPAAAPVAPPRATILADSVPAEFESADRDVAIVYTTALGCALTCSSAWTPSVCSPSWRPVSTAAWDGGSCGPAWNGSRSWGCADRTFVWRRTPTCGAYTRYVWSYDGCAPAFPRYTSSRWGGSFSCGRSWRSWSRGCGGTWRGGCGAR